MFGHTLWIQLIHLMSQWLFVDDQTHPVVVTAPGMDDSGSRHVRQLCLDDLVMALLIAGVLEMDGRSESIVHALHGTDSI